MVFTIVCAFILLGTIALVGNAQVLFVNADRADAAALLAAQAGASAIDPGALYSDRLVIAPDLAQARCQQAGRQAPHVIDVRCDVNGNIVRATVVEQVTMPIPLFSGAETVSATRIARSAYGGTTGGF